MQSTIVLIFEIALFLVLVLGTTIFLRGKKERSNKLFFYLSLFIGLWVFTNLMVYISNQPEAILLWYRLTYATAVPMILSIFVFSLNFPEPLSSKNKHFIFYVTPLAVIALVVSLLPATIPSASLSDGNFSFTFGPGFYVFIAFAALLIGLSIWALFVQLLRNSGNKKQQVKYVLIGLAAGSIFALVAELFLPLIGIDILINTGSIGAILLSAATGYAIVKYQLFDIRVILTEAAVFIVILIVLIQTFTSPEGQIFSKVAFLVALIGGGAVLIRSVRLEVEKREEVEKLAKEKIEALDELEQRNKNLATLQKISDIVLNESDMKVMTQKILDELPKQLEGCVGGMLSIVKQGQLVGYSMSSNNFSKKILSLVGSDLSKYSHPINREFNHIHRALIDRESVSSDKLTEFISPPISKPVAVSIQKLIGARHVEAFPLIAGGEPFGVMLFVFNKTKDEVHSNNYSIAKAISDDMSLAIQRAQAFVQLKEANEYLSQLDKMKDEFISMASHELNTPLAAIEGYLSMILDEGMGKIDKQSRKYLNRAYASSKRLAELILDLLNVSRIEQGRLKMKYSKVGVAELAQSVIHELQIKADEKKIYLKLQADKSVPDTWFDPDRIREVIVNLTGNALKFTNKGGVIIKVKKATKKILVEVVDTGRGIAKVDQPKLFHKFSQVRRDIDEHQGSGLGLYISKNFIELHKGKIWVDSDAGKGATFSFEIPIISKPPKEEGDAILEESVSSTQIETPKKGDVPKIIIDSTKGDI